MTKIPSLPDGDFGFPSLEQWIESCGGYHKIPVDAWTLWDRLYEAYRQHRPETNHTTKGAAKG
jgi:hypothetical protein